MLTHHVLFWLKAETTQEERTSFRQGLETLEKIEVIQKLYIGTPASISRAVVDTTYTFSLLIIFEDIKGHDVYQTHAIHKEFLDKNRQFFEKIIIYDSE